MFRIFSPDELVSNKLDSVLRHSGRNMGRRVVGERGVCDRDLSKPTCQRMLQGYMLTGCRGLFPSYETFLGIMHTMMVQYRRRFFGL